MRWPIPEPEEDEDEEEEPRPPLRLLYGGMLGRLSTVDAREVLATAFRNVFGRDGNQCEIQIALAFSAQESNFGQSCYRFCSSGHGKTCVEVSRTCDSWNWGAIQCRAKPPCPDGCFPATDTHADGTPYSICFRRYPTALAGAEAFLKEIYQRRPGVLTAAGRGDVDGVSAEARRTKYFELPLERHQRALRGNVDRVAKALGETPCSPAVMSSPTRTLLTSALVAGGLYAAYRVVVG